MDAIMHEQFAEKTEKPRTKCIWGFSELLKVNYVTEIKWPGFNES